MGKGVTQHFSSLFPVNGMSYMYENMFYSYRRIWPHHHQQAGKLLTVELCVNIIRPLDSKQNVDVVVIHQNDGWVLEMLVLLHLAFGMCFTHILWNLAKCASLEEYVNAYTPKLC